MDFIQLADGAYAARKMHPSHEMRIADLGHFDAKLGQEIHNGVGLTRPVRPSEELGEKSIR